MIALELERATRLGERGNMSYKGFARQQQQTLAPQSMLAELSQMPVPEAVEDEYGILSCIFNSMDAGATFREAASLLKPEHFVTPTLQDIWRGILKAHQENLPTEFRVQANYLQDFAQINSDVLKGVLNHISDSLHDPDNIGHYAERIVRKWESRQLLGALANGAKVALDASVSPEDALIAAERNLREVRESLTTKNPNRVSIADDICDEIIDNLEQIALGNKSADVVKTNVFYEFDQLGRGGLPGEIIAFASCPGGGKTTTAAAFANAFAKQNIFTLWISLEDSAQMCNSKILSTEAKISVSTIVDAQDIGIGDIQKLRDTKSKLNLQTLTCVQPMTMTFEGVEQAIAQAESDMRKRHGDSFTGFRVIIFDYLQYLGKFVDHNVKTSFIDSLTVKLGHIVKEMGATLYAFAQYNGELVKSGKRPEGLDVFADCKAIGQNADQIWGIWSEGYAKTEQLHNNSTLEYICLKNRRGATGAVTLGIKWAYGWIYSLLGNGSPNLYPADPARTTSPKTPKTITASEESPEVTEEIPGESPAPLEEFDDVEEDFAAKYNDPDLEVIGLPSSPKVTIEAEVSSVIHQAVEETVAPLEEVAELKEELQGQEVDSTIGDFEVGEEVLFSGRRDTWTPAKVLGRDEIDPLYIRIELLGEVEDPKAETSGKKYLRAIGEIRSVDPCRLKKFDDQAI